MQPERRSARIAASSYSLVSDESWMVKIYSAELQWASSKEPAVTWRSWQARRAGVCSAALTQSPACPASAAPGNQPFRHLVNKPQIFHVVFPVRGPIFSCTASRAAAVRLDCQGAGFQVSRLVARLPTSTRWLAGYQSLFLGQVASGRMWSIVFVPFLREQGHPSPSSVVVRFTHPARLSATPP